LSEATRSEEEEVIAEGTALAAVPAVAAEVVVVPKGEGRGGIIACTVTRGGVSDPMNISFSRGFMAMVDH
jgi:hypothetical protein